MVAVAFEMCEFFSLKEQNVRAVDMNFLLHPSRINSQNITFNCLETCPKLLTLYVIYRAHARPGLYMVGRALSGVGPKRLRIGPCMVEPFVDH